MADPAPPTVDRVVRLTCTLEGSTSRTKESRHVVVHSASTHEQVTRTIQNTLACRPNDTLILLVDGAFMEVSEVVLLAQRFFQSGELPTALPGTIDGLRAMVTVSVKVTPAQAPNGSSQPSSDRTVETGPGGPNVKSTKKMIREARPLCLRRDVGLRR